MKPSEIYARLLLAQERIIDHPRSPYERCAAIRIDQAKTAFPRDPNKAADLLSEADFYLSRADEYETNRRNIHFLRQSR
jgi:hypothetical protein